MIQRLSQRLMMIQTNHPIILHIGIQSLFVRVKIIGKPWINISSSTERWSLKSCKTICERIIKIMATVSPMEVGTVSDVERYQNIVVKKGLYLYLLKKHYLIAGLSKSKNNSMVLSNHMIRFGYQYSWRIGTQEVSCHINMGFTFDQVNILNPIPVN